MPSGYIFPISVFTEITSPKNREILSLSLIFRLPVLKKPAFKLIYIILRITDRMFRAIFYRDVDHLV
jgi:hypothetical protein